MYFHLGQAPVDTNTDAVDAVLCSLACFLSSKPMKYPLFVRITGLKTTVLT